MGVIVWVALVLAQTRVYIDIDQAGGYLLPIAVPNLLGEATDPQLAPQLIQVLRQDLSFSGLFRLLAPETYIDSVPQGLDNLRYSNWAAIGALGVIVGRLHPAPDASELVVELVLHDVVQHQHRLVGKEYRASRARYREVAHRFSDEVFKAFTGEPGPFNTQVVCVQARADGVRGKNIVIMDYDGHGRVDVIADGALNLVPTMSPQSTHLAYTSYRDGFPNLYIRQMATGEEERVTSGPGLALPGSWSRDGRFLLLSQTQEDNSDIFLYDTKRKRLRRLTTYWGIDVSPSFAPDGERLVFTSDRSGSPQLYLTDIRGRPPIRLTYEGKYNTSPAWSPRHDVIAFVGRSDADILHIYTIRADGRGLRRLTEGERSHESPTWAPDGHFLMYTSQQGDSWQRYLMREDGAGQRALVLGQEDCRSPQWIARITP
jgi:TolB protein